jgi:hypothetical protein
MAFAPFPRANAERNFQMAIAPGPPPKHFLKNCLGKGWRGEGSLAVLRRQAKPYGDWRTSAPCQRPLGAATISEIYFGICSSWQMRQPCLLITRKRCRRNADMGHQMPSRVSTNTEERKDKSCAIN